MDKATRWDSHTHGAEDGPGLGCGEKPIGRCVRDAKDAELAELLAEVERLRRWKAEAAEVILGLQDVGKALGLGLGEQITGSSAARAAEQIASHAKTEALRELVRYCFDENDAAVVVGGIETVECYVFDTIAELTGDEADVAYARAVHVSAAKTLAEKLGHADYMEADQ